MASITSWIRIEPRARDVDLDAGVAARLHDPLWLLARQWQLAELDGEDAGSAILARVRLATGRITGVETAEGVASVDVTTTPLEAIVESRVAPTEPIPAIRDRANAGRRLLRALVAGGFAELATRLVRDFPIDTTNDLLDASDRRFAELVARRFPDAAAVAEAARANVAAITTAAAAAAIVTAWLAWYDAREVASPAPAWDSTRLGYRFVAHAACGTATLRLAGEHRGDALGWSSFDVAGTQPESAPGATLVGTAMPAPVRYRGMPARRYWELEDAAVRWGAIDAAPHDITRMLLVEFALVYGNDWLVIPVACDDASVNQIRSLVVTDTFGVQTRIRSAVELDGHDGPWRMYTLTGTQAPTLLVLGAPRTLDGAALDRIELARSELSNLAWAIERRAERADGQPREVEARLERAPVSAGPRYQLGSPVPGGWHPFRPAGATGRLVRAMIPGAPQPVLTRSLSMIDAVDDGELAAGDVRLEAYRRIVRDATGRYHRWTAMRCAPIAPTATVTVAFDQIEGER